MHCLRTLVFIAIAGCQLYPDPAHARVYHGPAYGTHPTTIVALPAQPADCSEEQCRAVATAARMSLEVAGYTIVDAELVNAEMRRRTTTSNTDVHTAKRTEVEGKTWQDASPAEQARLVDDIGAEGVLETAIVKSDGDHVYTRRFTVALTMRTVDGRVIWRSDCADEGGDTKDERQALESATRCALESVMLW